MNTLSKLSADTVRILAPPFRKGNKVDGTRIPRRKQVNSEVLSTILTSIADNLPSHAIPGVEARFIPQITIDKMELNISLTLPLKEGVNVKELAEPLKQLGHHASGSRKYNAQRSLLFGNSDSKGYHEDDPTSWFSGMMRLPECRYTITIGSRSQARSFLPEERPTLPGKFSAYWPEYPCNAAGQRQLPVPLHICRKLYIDCVKEKHSTSECEAIHPGSSFLRATYTIDLNVNRALAHHPFMSNAKLTDEQMAQAFFPNPNVKQPKGMDNFCDPELTQTDITQGIRNTIHATMSVLYADLLRALNHVPGLPLVKQPPETWQDALQVARLSLVEVDRHLHAEDAPRAFCALKEQLTTWRANYRKRTHGATVDDAGNRNPAVDEMPTSISTVMRQGKGRTSTPEATVIVYKKRRDYVRVELRLREHNGLCYDMLTIPQGKKRKPILMVNDDAYIVPKRTNLAKSIDELVQVIQWVMITAQESFQRLMGTMEEAPDCSAEEQEKFIRHLRKVVMKPEEQSALNYIISSLKARQVLRAGVSGDEQIDRILRRLGDRGLFRYKGGQKTRRYFPNLSKLPEVDSSLKAGEPKQGTHLPGAGAAQAPGEGVAPGRWPVRMGGFERSYPYLTARDKTGKEHRIKSVLLGS